MLCCIGCDNSATPKSSQQMVYPNDIYIWQRQWTAQHEFALQQTQGYFRQLRVLAAQQHPQEGWITANINFAILKAQPQHKIAVIRLDGRLQSLNQKQQIQRILAVIQSWQAHGIVLHGVEIDFDCPTARLAEYQQFLLQLKQQLPPQLELSITALPDWLSQPAALTSLLKQVDHSVLQVHAVEQPSKGLFNPHQALRWVEDYAAIATQGFYVALPAYHAKITASGQIESEVKLPEEGQRQLLDSDAQQVADFIQQVERINLKHFKGWVWFRLALPQDQNVWTWQSFKKVLTKQPLTEHLKIDYQIHTDVGKTDKLYDIYLHNVGDRSMHLPKSIYFNAEKCIAGDILSGYAGLDLQQNQVLLKQPKTKQIRAGQRLYLGWLRCQVLDLDHFSIEDE